MASVYFWLGSSCLSYFLGHYGVIYYYLGLWGSLVGASIGLGLALWEYLKQKAQRREGLFFSFALGIGIFILGSLSITVFPLTNSNNDNKPKAHESYLQRPLLEPVIELGIRNPSAISTIITINNGGMEPVKDVSVNMRCISHNSDADTLLYFEGFQSMGNANAWWRIDTIGPNTSETKDSMESVERCLANSEVHGRGRVFARQLFVVDLSYRRSADNKEYKFSWIATLARDQNTGKPFLWPENLTEFYRRILDNHMAPAFSMKP